MNINYIKIYKDECESDEVFEQYCSLDHAIHEDDAEDEYVIFYTVSINDAPQILH